MRLMAYIIAWANRLIACAKLRGCSEYSNDNSAEQMELNMTVPCSGPGELLVFPPPRIALEETCGHSNGTVLALVIYRFADRIDETQTHKHVQWGSRAVEYCKGGQDTKPASVSSHRWLFILRAPHRTKCTEASHRMRGTEDLKHSHEKLGELKSCRGILKCPWLKTPVTSRVPGSSPS